MLLLFFIVSIAKCCCLLQNHDHYWVQIELSENRSVILQSSRKTGTVDFDAVHSSQRVDGGADTLKIAYQTSSESIPSHVVPNPRRLWTDGLTQRNTLTGLTTFSSVGYLSLTFPIHALDVLILESDRQSNSPHTLRIPRQRHYYHQKMSAQQALATPVVRTFNLAGNPDYQKNLVFVSGGYQAAEMEKFFSDVQSCFDFLRGMHNQDPELQPAPWDRYMSLINVFGVFQASVESGASYPVSQDGKNLGGKPPGTPLIRNNNLGCEYGTATVRMLHCDMAKSQTLASYAPPKPEKTTIVALVNDDTYGGSGTAGLATVYNGGQMLRVIIHELGHAAAGLSDEYDYQTTIKDHLTLKNCWWANSGTPWDQWRGPNVPSDQAKLGDPVATCSFTNYFRPTDSHCLMNTITSPEYCAACADFVTRAIYDDLQNLATPRCPREFETLIVPYDSYGYLFVNQKFFQERVKTDVTLTQGDGTPLRRDNGPVEAVWNFLTISMLPQTCSPQAATCSVKVVGSLWGLGDHLVNLTVTDKTEFVINRIPRMTYVTTFRVKVIDTNKYNWSAYMNCRPDFLGNNPDTALPSSVTVNTCPDQLTQDTTLRRYCGICAPGKICNDSYVSAPFEARANFDSAVSRIEAVMFGLGGGLVGGGIILFVVLWALFARHLGKSVQVVVPWPPIVNHMRNFVRVCACLVMLFAIGILLVAVFLWSKATSLQKSAILAAIIFSCILYVIAFVGLTAATYRHQILLTVNGIILTFTGIALLVISALWFWIGTSTGTETLKNMMIDQWESLVKSDPKTICTFENDWKCSGLTVSCFVSSHSQCPINCELSNHNYPEPCWEVFRYQQKKLFYPVGVICIILTILVYVGIVSNWVMCCFIRKKKQQVRRRLTRSHILPADLSGPAQPSPAMDKVSLAFRNMTEHERKKLLLSFDQQDRTGNGRVNIQELQHFLSGALHLDLTLKECAEAMERMEKDAQGRVNFYDLMRYSDEGERVRKREAVLKDFPDIELGVSQPLYDDFVVIDFRETGFITLQSLKDYYRKSFGIDPDPQDLQEALRAVHHDGHDAVNFAQFLQMFAAAKKHAQMMQYAAPPPASPPLEITAGSISRSPPR